MVPKHTAWIRIASNAINNEMKSKWETRHFIENLDEDAVKLIHEGYGNRS